MGQPLKLFESYLKDSKQYTSINDCMSNTLLIYVGVPQCSVLGPLLFLIYINDLPLASNLLTKLFADDTCLAFSAANISDLQITINLELKKIQNWLTGNKLSLNYK